MIGKEEMQAVQRVMERGILSGFTANINGHHGGEEVQALEKEWAEYFGVKHAIAVNSATSGLYCALAATGVDKNNGPYGDMPSEVIVTPYSMTCSASLPLLFGAKPVFADIEPDYFCLDPKSVEKRITEDTKAILIVDLFGQPYNADAINAIAKKHGIMVIEDAAQAIGAKYKGKYAGTLGDIGVYSLNFHKHIQCGEGGIVVTDDDVLAEKVRLMRNHAESVINDAYIKDGTEEFRYNCDWISMVGMNLRMCELEAAIAREQLKKLPGILEKVRGNFIARAVKIRPECQHAFYRYAWDSRYTSVEKELLDDEDCTSKQGYITPIYQMPLFRSLGYDQRQCPVCEGVQKNIVLAWLKEVV